MEVGELAVNTADKKIYMRDNTSGARSIVEVANASGSAADDITIGDGEVEIATTAGQITIGLGEETAFGEAFQNIINFSVGSPSFFIWNEVDDSQTITWVDVEPGSTD